MTKTKITVKGGWIEVTLEGETLTLAVIGSPLQYLLKPQTSIQGRHKQSEEKGRYRRLAVEAMRAVDPAAELDEVETVWTWRNG